MKVFDSAMIFKAIVERGSMVGAAEFLCITPPVVSKKLSYLESELGLQLLKRTTRHVELTEVGEVFYERISGISKDWNASIEEVVSLNSNPKGTLQISSPQPLCSRLLVPILHEFQALYPDIKLELLHTNYEQLPHQSADITICRKLDEFNSMSYIGIPLFTYHNSLFASKTYLDKHPKITQVADLKKHQCITYGVGKPAYQWQFEDRSFVDINPYITADNTEIIISSAVNGLGIAYIPQEILQQELAYSRLANVLPEVKSKPFETYLYYQSMKFTPKKIRLFIDFLKNYF
ncbi:LysR family transcriptional regulator [Pseudoalteromonas sp. NEC-BIFX-2020_015]|uniref:LysR family transcriptional regulator n=1 Tax=Pseudoalteromonas sp. NEC-BIFX-2020_015 TaxID=2729544 RepID=UPI0014613B61|nr:LysR family transcriptional regulator [Pseudoalteromonas sp. NEC-BIFX-2020_015]NMR27145.1 LysR family transcriptional regulator [Pseudoalteromonas sp. NEC-BIFX-2020_015]